MVCARKMIPTVGKLKHGRLCISDFRPLIYGYTIQNEIPTPWSSGLWLFGHFFIFSIGYSVEKSLRISKLLICIFRKGVESSWTPFSCYAHAFATIMYSLYIKAETMYIRFSMVCAPKLIQQRGSSKCIAVRRPEHFTWRAHRN